MAKSVNNVYTSSSSSTCVVVIVAALLFVVVQEVVSFVVGTKEKGDVVVSGCSVICCLYLYHLLFGSYLRKIVDALMMMNEGMIIYMRRR